MLSATTSKSLFLACTSFMHQTGPKITCQALWLLHEGGLISEHCTVKTSLRGAEIIPYCAVESRELARNDSSETAVKFRERRKSLVICFGQLTDTRTARRNLTTVLSSEGKIKLRDCLRFRKISNEETKMAERKLVEEVLGFTAAHHGRHGYSVVPCCCEAFLSGTGRGRLRFIHQCVFSQLFSVSLCSMRRRLRFPERAVKASDRMGMVAISVRSHVLGAMKSLDLEHGEAENLLFQLFCFAPF